MRNAEYKGKENEREERRRYWNESEKMRGEFHWLFFDMNGFDFR